MEPQHLLIYAQHFSYLGVLIFSALAGILLPVPEEVILLLVGYLAGAGFLNPYLAWEICVGALLLSDSALFFLSRRGNSYVEKLRHKLRESRLQKYEGLMQAHLGKTIFLLRFIVGLRFLGPILAGAGKLRWQVFAVYDFLAVILYSAALIFLGYHFHNQVVGLIVGMELVRHIISLAVFGLIGWLISFYLHKQFFAGEENKKFVSLL